MANDFNANMDIGFTVSGLARVVSDVNRTLKNIGPVDIPVTVNGKGASNNPLNSSIAKSVNSLNTALAKTSIQSRTTSSSFIELTKSINKIQDSRKRIQEAGSELEKFGRQANQTVKRFGAFVLVVNAFNGLQQAITSSVGKAITFEKEMTKVSQVTGTAYKDLKGLTDEITRLATTFGVSSEKIGNVALTLAQAGLTAKETKTALDVLAKTELSATFEDIGQTTEAAIAVMAQFGTKSKDLASQLGAINTVAAKFAVESSDLAVVIRRAGGAFQATGGDLNELLALFTSVRATTRESAESISTGLRTIFTRLQRTKTVNFLEDLGIQLRDVDEQTGKVSFVGIYKSIERISAALKDIKGNDPRFNQIVEELGGFRQVSKVIPLLKQFETSQKALSVARRAGNSVDEDAIIAQKTLANQFARVREEFDALIRGFLDDRVLKGFISTTLDLASALIKLGDALRPIASSLSILGLIGGIKLGASVSKGFAPGLFPPIKRARGGPVPGSGSGDTVPAMLEPGEFVLRKSAVNALGMGNVAKINKYGKGGLVKDLFNYLKASRTKSKEQGLGSILGPTQTVKGVSTVDQIGDLFNRGGIRRSLGLFKNNNPTSYVSDNTGGTGLADIGKKVLGAGSKIAGIGGSFARKGISAISNTAKRVGSELVDFATPAPLPARGLSRNQYILKESLAIIRKTQKDMGLTFSKELVSSLRVTSNLPDRFGGQAKGSFNLGSKQVTLNSSALSSRKQLKETLLHELGHSVDLMIGGQKGLASRRRDTTAQRLGRMEGSRVLQDDTLKSRVRIGDKAKYRYGPEEGFANLFKQYILNKNTRTKLDKDGFKRIIKKVSTPQQAEEFLGLMGIAKSIGLNKGGSVPGSGDTDKIRALLTPGEFVVNKKSAQAFGYDNLADINKFATGGPVPDPFFSGTNSLAGKKRRKTRRPGPVTGYPNTNPPAPRGNPFFAGTNSLAAAQYGPNPPPVYGPPAPPPTPPVSAASASGNSSSSGSAPLGFGKAKSSGPSVGAVGLALSVGPALLQQFAGASDSVKPFLEGLTLAGGLLTTFAFAIKKDIAPLTDNIEQLSDVSKDYGNQLEMLERSSKEFAKVVAAGTSVVKDPITNLPKIGKDGNPEQRLTQQALDAKEKLAEDGRTAAKIAQGKTTNDAELGNAQKELAELNKFNKIAKRVVIGAAVAGAIGTIASSEGSRRAKAGEAGAEGFSAVGGGLTGGANGATLGLTLGGLLGPKGALAGAIIGGLGGIIYGAVTGKSEAADTVAQVKFEKTIDKLNKSLNLVNSGKSPLSQQRGGISSGLKEINEKFLTTTGAQFQSFKGQVNNSIDGLENLFNESVKGAKTLDQFKAANEDLILVLSRFGGQTIPELEKSVQNEIDKNNKNAAAQKSGGDNDRRLEEVFNIVGAVGDANRAIKSLGDNIDVLDQIINNSFSSKNNFDFSALSNIGSSRLSDVRKQAESAGTLIGGPAIGISADVVKASELSRKIPSLLNDVINGSQLDEEGDARDKIRNRLGKGKEGGFAADLLSSAIDKEIGGTGSVTELIKKFNEDPVGLAKRIQASLDPFISVLTDTAPLIQAAATQYADSFANARAHLEKQIDGFIASIDIKQIGAEFKAASFGKSISFDEAQGFDNERFTALGGKGRNPERLAFDLQTANSKILGAESAKNDPANQTQEAIKHLNDTIHENTIKSQEATRSLEYLADVNGRLINVQQELGRLRQERQNKASLGADFAFGDPSAQRDIVKGLIAVKTIRNNIDSGASPLAGLTNEMKELARNITQRFASDNVFIDKNGNKQNGQQFENEIAGGVLGVDFNSSTGEENRVEQIGKVIIAEGGAARDALNKILSTNIDTYIKKIDERFGTFFTELKAALGEKEKEAKADFNAGIDTQLSRINERLGNLDFISKVTGTDVNDKNTVGQVKSVITDINKNNELTDKIGAIGRAKQDYFKTGNTKGVERELGGQFVKDLSQKEKDIAFGGQDEEDRKPQLEFFFKQETDKIASQSETILKGANEKLGAGVGGVAQNLVKLEKALADIEPGTTKAGLEEEKKQLEANKRAKGGIIGLATGGKVRGTDTVPAMTTDGKPYMLTPGEYVMKTSAVQKYGKDFMNKVNGGYLAGGGTVYHKKNFYGKAPEAESIYPSIPPVQKSFGGRDTSPLSLLKDTIPGVQKSFGGRDTSPLSLLKDTIPNVQKSFGGRDTSITSILKDTIPSVQLSYDRTKQLPPPIIPKPISGTVNSPSFSASVGAAPVPIEKSNSVRPNPRKNDTSFVDSMRAKRLEEERIRHNRNNLNGLDIKERRNGEIYQARNPSLITKSADSDVDIQRRDFQKRRSDLIKQGLSPIAASRELLKAKFPTATPANNTPQAPAAVGANPTPKGATPQAGQQAIEKFNEVLTKLQGVKITLEGNVTVDVRILDSNLGDTLNNKFKEAVSELVITQIDSALNQFASSNNLPYTPKPTGSKSVVKKQGK